MRSDELADQLQAEVAMLTAERDRLREERDEAQKQAAELLGDALDHGGRSDLKAAEAERDTLAAQLARTKPVVEAAEAWLAQRRSAGAFLREPRAELIALADALDAYRE